MRGEIDTILGIIVITSLFAYIPLGVSISIMHFIGLASIIWWGTIILLTLGVSALMIVFLFVVDWVGRCII